MRPPKHIYQSTALSVLSVRIFTQSSRDLRYQEVGRFGSVWGEDILLETGEERRDVDQSEVGPGGR